jgi:hypothetical protein
MEHKNLMTALIPHLVKKAERKMRARDFALPNL